MIKPVILGVQTTALSADERALFAHHKPAGLILFARNIEAPDQLRRLCAEFRDITGQVDPLILIDQEGGRVARLRPPIWRDAPAMAEFAELATPADERALALNCRLLAQELNDLSINVDCLPVLDLPQPGADPIISDRAFSPHPDVAARLGRVAVDTLLDQAVLPVIKHIPGHGRALVDSHLTLPCVDTPLAELQSHDFIPFRALSDAPLAMTAHILYTAIDDRRCATLSSVVIDLIRHDIGFGGILMSDDLAMHALTGAVDQRALASLSAGCDLALHCSGDPVAASAILEACSMMIDDDLIRLEQAKARRNRQPVSDPAAWRAGLAEFGIAS